MSEEKSLRLLKIYEDLVKGIAGENDEALPKVNSWLQHLDEEITEDVLLDLILADEETLNEKTGLDLDESSKASSLFSPLTHEILDEISLDLLFDDDDALNETEKSKSLSPFHLASGFSKFLTSTQPNSPANCNEVTSNLDNVVEPEIARKETENKSQPLLPDNSCHSQSEVDQEKEILSSSKDISSNPEPVPIPPRTTEELARYKRNSNPLSCKICDKEFSKKANLKTHYLLHARIKPHICQICFRRFTRNTALIVHSLIHSGERKFTCNICDKSFARSDDLEKHGRVHSGEKPFTCNLCKKQFTHQNNLRRHCLRHKGVKRFVCELCDEMFLDKEVLLSHLKSHLAENITKNDHKTKTSLNPRNNIEKQILQRLHACNVCGNLYNRRDRLLRHKLTHQSSVSCDVCGAKFKHKDDLQSHLLSHMDLELDCFSNMNDAAEVCPPEKSKSRKKSHVCNLCFKMFSRKALLTRHHLVHTGEKPHECHVCPKKFSQKITLERHLLTHTRVKPFVCNICQKAFGRKNHLQRHYALHSSKELF